MGYIPQHFTESSEWSSNSSSQFLGQKEIGSWLCKWYFKIYYKFKIFLTCSTTHKWAKDVLNRGYELTEPNYKVFFCTCVLTLNTIMQVMGLASWYSNAHFDSYPLCITLYTYDIDPSLCAF